MRKNRIRELQEKIAEASLEEALSFAFDDDSEVKVSMVVPLTDDSRTRKQSKKTHDVLYDLIDDVERAMETRSVEDKALRKISDMLTETALPGNTIWSAMPNVKSIAVLANEEKTLTVPLSGEYKAVAMVGSEYYIKPIMEEMGTAVDYYVLELSSDRFGWAKGNRHDVKRQKMPEDVVEFFSDSYDNSDENARLMEKGEKGALDFITLEGHYSPYEGHKSRNDVRQSETKKFFRLVNHAVKDMLAEPGVPIFLVALPEHISAFREICTIDGIVDESIAYDPNSLGKKELLSHINSIIENMISAEDEELGKHSAYLFSKKMGSDDPDFIAQALYDKNIATVIVSAERGESGMYMDNGRVVYGGNGSAFQGKPIDACEPDLANSLMINAMKQGANVIVSDKVSSVADSGIIAFFRYPQVVNAEMRNSESEAEG